MSKLTKSESAAVIINWPIAGWAIFAAEFVGLFASAILLRCMILVTAFILIGVGPLFGPQGISDINLYAHTAVWWIFLASFATWAMRHVGLRWLARISLIAPTKGCGVASYRAAKFDSLAAEDISVEREVGWKLLPQAHWILLSAPAALFLKSPVQSDWRAWAMAALGVIPILWRKAIAPRIPLVADPFTKDEPDLVVPSAPARMTAAEPVRVKEKTVPEYDVPTRLVAPQKVFADILGMADLKKQLLEVGRAVIQPMANGQDARNGILLFGEPGNGKTVFAEALAGELGVKWITVTRGMFSSQWVGNMPKVLSLIFEQAKRNAPCVLFFDEIDTIIKSRGQKNGSGEDENITTTFLTESVDLRRYGVLLIAATNYPDKLDAAGSREGRFDFKIEVTPPDEVARVGLLAQGASRVLPKLAVDQGELARIARRWNGFSVARLKAVTQALADLHAKSEKGLRKIDFSAWSAALRIVQGVKAKVPLHAKSIDQMVFGEELGRGVRSIAQRLKRVVEIEELGGTLPGGILFFGPPGTGKTATAMAIAKDSGWSFITASGPDLIHDRDKLDEVYRQAKDLRPAIIFIDEADDVIGDRQASRTPEMVNKLLTLMDGARDKVSDVIWIAATNHPEDVDSALLRSGRFTEKLLFSPPDREAIGLHVRKWLQQKAVSAASPGVALLLEELLDGQSIANVEGVLQQALNLAISDAMGREPPTAPSITESNVRDAFRVVVTW